MLLRRSLVTEAGRGKVEEILKAAERSTTTTSQLLAFSRKESLHPETVDLAESVRDLASLLPQMIGEDIRLSIVPSPKPSCASIDPGLFQQAIMNLVVNARHAMPDGGELTIEADCVEVDQEALRGHPDAGAGPYAVIAVSDTGTGMGAETLTRIFDPFFTTKEVGVGTGMGLAMVYGFAAQSGGFIQVDSEPGKGSTFRLYFSLVPSVEAPTSPAPTPEPGTLPGGTETLLVVEDEEAVRYFAVSALRECGYTVMEAGSATEALPLGEHYEGRIDLLVTDVVMPTMNGVELAKRLRSVRPGMSVLLISGYSQDMIDEKHLLEPGTELLVKPFEHTVLTRAVRRLLDRANPTPRPGA